MTCAYFQCVKFSDFWAFGLSPASGGALFEAVGAPQRKRKCKLRVCEPLRSFLFLAAPSTPLLLGVSCHVSMILRLSWLKLHVLQFSINYNTYEFLWSCDGQTREMDLHFYFQARFPQTLLAGNILRKLNSFSNWSNTFSKRHDFVSSSRSELTDFLIHGFW